MKSVDAKLLAAGSDVLSSQHGSVGGGLVAIGLDLHTTSNTADGLTATGITQVSHNEPYNFFSIAATSSLPYSRVDEPQIGDVDEGIVEGGEDTGDTEDELACIKTVSLFIFSRSNRRGRIPSRTEGPREMFSWGARATFLGGILK